MMITWQFENAFQNLGEYSKVSIFPGFEEQQSGNQSSPGEYKGRLLKTNTLLKREGS